jgi:farnesyl-diphosphate farnesyltransferase
LLRGVSRSFYLSIRVLPPALRHPVALGYLLARATDTVADTAVMPADQRQATLSQLAAAIEGDATARAALPDLGRGFAPLQDDAAERQLILSLPQCLDALDAVDAADRADIRTVLRHITRGQSLDVARFGAAEPVRALCDAGELEEYTYLVAGCVGEFWTSLSARHLPGFATLSTQTMSTLGRHYGMGLQLINILRDLTADLAIGRCYLPADELAAAGVRPEDLASSPERVSAVRTKWLAVAEEHMAQGMRYADAVNHRRLRAASALPALIGMRTLALLKAAPAFSQPVKLPRAQVRAILWRLGLTMAARGPLAAQFAQLRREAGTPPMGQSSP